MGTGRIYLPKFPEPRPPKWTMTAPNRVASVYDLNGATKTPSDYRKPQLLRHVVFNEELKDIVNRLTRPTMATRMRAVNFRPENQYTYVDMGSYKWNKMNVYSDYQKHIYQGNGSLRQGFMRTVKANYNYRSCH